MEESGGPTNKVNDKQMEQSEPEKQRLVHGI